MRNLEKIAKQVFEAINENSITIFYSADLNDISPAMCSPYSEGWFWANDSKSIIDYVFEIIIANYLINDTMAYGDFVNEDDEEFDFLSAVEKYKEYKTMNKKRTKSIEELVSLYHKNINQELNYIELVKLLINLEQCSSGAGIDLEFETFSSPLEARHSRYLNVDKFDYKNLKNNF